MIRFFVERHLLVNVLAIATVVLAFYLSPSISREYLPSVDMPRVLITAQLPGASARDVETKLTIPIEEAIEDVDGIDEYYTTISDSVSVTTVELYMDSSEAQVLTAIQDLRDALDGISDFPPEMEEAPTLVRLNPGKSAIIEIALAGPMDDLVPLAEDLEKRIERLPGISRVTIVGLQDPEVRVLVDPMLAESHGVTLLDVVNAIQARNVSTTGAVLEASEHRSQVIVWSRFEDPLEVGDTVVAASPEGLVRARDIAHIESAREDTGLIVHTNAQQGLSLIVRKREGGDAIEAVDAIRKLMEATPIPPSVGYEYVNDITFFTRNRLEVMATNGVMGAVIVALILLAFMRKSAALWVLIGIPIVFCGAIILLLPLGMTFNLFTLTGLVIVLGMVVDDAVVVSENIVSHRERGLNPTDAAVIGTQEMVKPVMAAAITTALAFGPIVAMGGIPGKVMWQIPAMVVMVLLFSLLESFFILPAHMSSVRASSKSEKRAWLHGLEDRYRIALRACLNHRGLVIGAAFAALFFVIAVIQPRVNFVQFPQADATLLFMKMSAPAGTPLERTEAIATDLQRQIQDITSDDFRAVTARIGHQDVNGNEKMRGEAEHEALLTIVFKELDRRYTNQEWIQVLQQQLNYDSRVHLTFQSEYVGPPTDQPVTLHVLANDDASRRAAATEIAEWVGAQPGITQLQVDERPGTPKLDLNLDHDKIAMLGLDARSIALAVQAAFFGIEASEHRDVDDTTELRVQFAPYARVDLDSLLDTSVRSLTGERVPLRDVVRPVEVPGLDRIYHREGSRAATVRASFTPDSSWTAVSFAQKVRTELFPRFANEPDLELVIGGEAADTAETTGALGSVALLVVLAISVVIWILLGSLLEALSVVIVIPFALAGVILAFFLHGLQLSMPAVIGTIGLAGVVVNASIVMMDCVHRNIRASDGQKPIREVVEDAVVSRLRPILITTLTTLGGVLPTAYGIGGYDQIVSPMSIAIGWGLLFSTVVTLFVIPALSSLAHDATAAVSRASGRLARQQLE
jgi:multidrug efflux pump subunit AcrB